MIAAATKFESFAVDPEEKWAFAGNASGEIATVLLDTFNIEHVVQAHAGIIQAVACHREAPYVAALSTDRHISIWRYNQTGALEHICQVALRSIKPDNDKYEVPYVHSTSQAIGFHDTRLRIVTRSANAGVLELEFTAAGDVRVLQCRRLHGEADLITARYVVASDAVLTGSIDGQLVLSEHGNIIRRWVLGGANVHWLEHVGGSTYLLASDLRFVARVDIDRDEILHVGSQFTRDDLEHVTFNKTSSRAFVGSFDRTIYEIDPRTCEPTRTAFRAPFKCRWVKTLERSPQVAIVQCRNGALYKADIDTGSVLAELRTTPPALWTAVQEQSGTTVLAGDGDRIVELRRVGRAAQSRTVLFDKTERALNLGDNSYTKRAALDTTTGTIMLGRTSGRIYAVERGLVRLLADVGSAVRDITVDGERGWVFAACEDGSARKLNLATGETLAQFDSEIHQPLWSLSYNAKRGILAVAERVGSLLVLDAEDLSLRIKGIETARPKRMKWLDDDVLLYNYLDEIRRFDLRSGVRDLLVASVGNTVEDFIWDRGREYLVFISYMQDLYLADLDTGEIINRVPDQIDYSKGLAWISDGQPTDYPLDFITFGRSGTAHYFRIHDEKLLALGSL